jgi:hypothetical protein
MRSATSSKPRLPRKLIAILLSIAPLATTPVRDRTQATLSLPTVMSARKATRYTAGRRMGLAHARCAAGEEAGQCRRRGIRRGRASTVGYWRRSLRAVESYRPERLDRPAQRAISVRSAAQEMLPLLSSVGGEYSSMVELLLDLACDVALEASDDLRLSYALAGAPRHVILGRLIGISRRASV